MADRDECGDCFDPEEGIVRSELFSSRREALALYIRLQEKGYLPSMCENNAGKLKVCYAENRRIA